MTRVPKYRRHSSGRAFVCWKKKRHYLPGDYNSPESQAVYKRFVKALMAAQVPGVKPARPGAVLLLAEVVQRYMYAITRVGEGTATDPSAVLGSPVGADAIEAGRLEPEVCHVKRAMSFLIRNHALVPIDEFGPLALSEVRDEMAKARRLVRRKMMIDERPQVVSVESEKPWTRRYVLDQVARIRRFFSWAVSQEIIAAEKYDALRHLSPLRKKKRRIVSTGLKLRESRKVRPANSLAVERTKASVSPTVADMIEVHRLAGMRPTEVCIMRWCDIDEHSQPWEYRPAFYKTDELDDEVNLDMPILLGPKAQAVLKKYRDRPKDAFIFNPRESVAWHHEQRWNGAGTAKRREPKTSRIVRDRFDAGSYRQAVKRGAQKAGVKYWTPYQLRHTSGTAVRKKYKLEGAQVFLRHRHAKVTETYAERNADLARMIALEMG